MKKRKVEANMNFWGISLLLSLLFLTLKLTNIIDWNWIWIFSPLWICFILSMITLLIFMVVFKDFIKKEVEDEY